MESVFPLLAGLTLRGNLIDDTSPSAEHVPGLPRAIGLKRAERKNRLIMLSALAWHYCYMRACAYSEGIRRLLANMTDTRCCKLLNSIGVSIAYRSSPISFPRRMAPRGLKHETNDEKRK